MTEGGMTVGVSQEERREGQGCAAGKSGVSPQDEEGSDSEGLEEESSPKKCRSAGEVGGVASRKEAGR